MVDLLAAVPSIVFGLWGIFVLAPTTAAGRQLPQRHLGWFFLFARATSRWPRRHDLHRRHRARRDDPADHHLRHPRGVRQTPLAHIEAAQALGATKWEVVRMTAALRSQRRSSPPPCSASAAPRRDGRGADHPARRREAGHWSLFDGGYTFASKIASAAAEFSYAAADGRLHRRRFRVVRADLRRQRAGRAARRRREGAERMTDATLDPAGQGADLPPRSAAAPRDQEPRRDVDLVSDGVR